MPILQPNDEKAVRERFEVELKQDVNLTLFTMRSIGGLYIPGRECKSCGPVQQLLEKVAGLSSKLHLDVVDFYSSEDDAKARGVDKIPATLISTDHGYDVKYYGLPSGYEFAVLLDTIAAASSSGSPLHLETRRRLKALKESVHIQVFVTPG